MKDKRQKAKKGELVIERVFNAPLELVWRAWTEQEHIKRWWGPKDFTAPEIQIDFREGGKYLYCMRSDMGPKQWQDGLWSTGVFREIVPMEKIVSTDSFADEKGNVVPATHYGMSDKFPMEMTVIATFEEIKEDPTAGPLDGKTKLTLRHGSFPESDIEGARQGWNQSLDKLSDIVWREKEVAKMRSSSVGERNM